MSRKTIKYWVSLLGRENQHALQNFLADLKQMGAKQVNLEVNDGHQATMNVITHHVSVVRG